MSHASRISIEPMDEFNRKLVDYVHPADWINPAPAPKYNLVVIGGGPAGLVTAAGAAGLGAKVALVEKHLMGGDCLNVGCVPSKCVIRSGRLASAMRRASRLGIADASPEVDFAAVMRRMREVRSRISHVDSVARYSRELGVDVYLGAAQFTGPDTVHVDGKTLRFKRACIATGARALELPIAGLAEAKPHTNETIFTLTELPKRIAVIGAGPIGCELAQAFSSLGSKVTVIEAMGQIMIREDADAVAIVRDRMEKDGVEVIVNAKIGRVSRNGGERTVHFAVDGAERSVTADEILMGAGRKPNVEGLGLELAAVDYDPRSGIKVNDNLQTTNPNVYAAGDVCMAWKFTHAADFAARIVIQNALFLGKKKLSSLTMPWCTYTHPEIAHVGLYASEAEARGVEVDTYVQRFDEVDRALADGDPEGFVKVHVQKGTDRIIGATIVAGNAGDLIGEVALAVTNGLGLKAIANTIHPYPTQADAIRRIGDQYNRTRLTPLVKRAMKWWLRVTG